MTLKEKLENLPDKCGVYIFKDDLDRIIYIGKAKSLKNRVKSYFKDYDKNESPRRLWLRKQIRDMEFIVMDSQVEALILETNLIKRHRPYFNVDMKDDKRHPCIEITVYEKYPRIRKVRRTENKKSRYFGPYTSGLALNRVFRLIQKAFLIRTCNYDIDKPLRRPCLDFHVNLCTAPCVRNISEEDYRKSINRASEFLDGKTDEILAFLKSELADLVEKMQYERCAVIRDIIESIHHITQSRPTISKPGTDADYIGLYFEEDSAAITLMQVRNGKLMGRQKQIMETPVDINRGEMLEKFIQRRYKPGFYIPPKIYLSHPLEDADTVREWLEKIRGRHVSIKTPKIGQKKKTVNVAVQNARECLLSQRSIMIARRDKNRKALENLKQRLEIAGMPRRIEGYDISNIGGKMAVASMVVFLEGEPYKSHYRRFRIRLKDGPDDFAMIYEVVTRRLKNLKLGEMESFRERPDLILIDGGKGQLSAAVEAADKVGIDGLEIISIAKREEEIFKPGRTSPMPLYHDQPGLKLLQRVRDEAHRFAVSYHRKLRRKGVKVSILDSIPGISKKRKETLLQNFDSIDAIRSATLYDLQELPGFNRKVAENVLSFLGLKEEEQQD